MDAAHVYWTNSGTGTIGRANLDGTGVNQSFITGAERTRGGGGGRRPRLLGQPQRRRDRARQPRRHGRQPELHHRRQTARRGVAVDAVAPSSSRAAGRGQDGQRRARQRQGVRQRAGRAAFASVSVPGIKGRRFVPLTEARQIPSARSLDTRKGALNLTSASTKAGQVFSGTSRPACSRRCSRAAG